MSIFSKTLRFALTLLLPFIMLINLIGFISVYSNSTFIDINNTPLQVILTNWADNKFFGFSSFANMLSDFGSFDFSKLITDLQTFFNFATGGIGNIVTDWVNMSVIEKIFRIFQSLFDLLLAPITTGFQGLFVLVDVLQYAVHIIKIIGTAIAGYYNVTGGSSVNSGWNDISDYVYYMATIS